MTRPDRAEPRFSLQRLLRPGAISPATAAHRRLRGLPLLLLLTLGAACRHGGGEPAHVVPQLDPMQPRRVAFAPGGGERLLVLEATGLVGIWDVADLGHPERLAWIPAGAVDACFTADGKDVVTGGWDGRLRRWSGNGRLVWTSAVGHDGPVRALAIGADGIVSGGEDGTLRFWSLEGTARRAPLAAHQGFVVSVAISPGGDLASAGVDESDPPVAARPVLRQRLPRARSPSGRAPEGAAGAPVEVRPRPRLGPRRSLLSTRRRPCRRGVRRRRAPVARGGAQRRGGSERSRSLSGSRPRVLAAGRCPRRRRLRRTRGALGRWLPAPVHHPTSAAGSLRRLLPRR